MTAIILAAGVARRLAPLTDHTQKSLLPVGGRAILARMLEALHAVGVRHVVVVVGHCADQVTSARGNRSFRHDGRVRIQPRLSEGLGRCPFSRLAT